MTNKIIFVFLAFVSACGGAVYPLDDPQKQDRVTCGPIGAPPNVQRELCGPNHTVVECESPTTDPGNCYAAPEIPVANSSQQMAKFWCC